MENILKSLEQKHKIIIKGYANCLSGTFITYEKNGQLFYSKQLKADKRTKEGYRLL